MKRFLFVAALAIWGATFCATAESGGSLTSFLAGQGLAGAKLERRLGNHLFVPCSINQHRAALMIDTGAPITIIDKNSITTFGLSVEKTDANVIGMLGRSWERFGASKVKTISMGNCTVTNVPVGLVDMSRTNDPLLTYRLEHLNGILGTREMRKFGMIIDCTRQMLYVNPNGPSASLSQGLSSFLTGRGFTRVPLRLKSGGHFDVEGSVNGQPVRLMVDTGAPHSVIDHQVAIKAGLSYQPMPRFRAGGAEGKSQMMKSADIKELKIGTFTIPKANVTVLSLSSELTESNAGFLGAEHLAFNFAVIDVGGLALYLRRPD